MVRPVAIFVHGLFSSQRTWEDCVRLLSGDEDISTALDLRYFSYPTTMLRVPFLRRIPRVGDIADRLRTELEVSYSDRERIVLVGHSMGGLVILRYLAKMLADNRGKQLSRIRRVVLLACPNDGSQALLLLRRFAGSWLFWRQPQEEELRPFNEAVAEAKNRVLHSIVHATNVASDRCPIPIATYAGESDNIVSPVSARGAFALGGTLPGDHLHINKPDSADHLAFRVLKHNLIEAMQEPFPSIARRTDPVTPGDVYTELTTFEPIEVGVGPTAVQVAIHAGPIDQMRNVDIIVSSENIYYEMAKPFKPSTSGRLRRAGAKKNAAGEIVEDTIFVELNDWMRKHGKHGLAVAVGTVAPTSAGELAQQGVQRIYHAAIVVPRIGSNEYDVNPQTISMAVHQVFDLARRERKDQGLRLSSICFPLFGAGRGRLDPAVSFDWISRALWSELQRDPTWSIHFCTWGKDETEFLRNALGQKARDSRP